MAVRWKTAVKIASNVLIILSLAIPMLTLELAAKPYTRGFFCYDETLMHPFKESTVSNAVLVIFGMGLPTICILVVEGFNYHVLKRYPIKKRNIGCCNVSSLAWACGVYIAAFIFGAGINQDLTDVCKYMVGRLRPHFLSVCDPDFGKLNCSRHSYIVEDVCRGTDLNRIKEARLSFPSGHASMSAYCMVYLVLYLQARFKLPDPFLLKPLIQAVVFFLALGCGLSRISDYKHHPLDIGGGFALGTTIAILTVFYVSGLYSKRDVCPVGTTANHDAGSGQRETGPPPEHETTKTADDRNIEIDMENAK